MILVDQNPDDRLLPVLAEHRNLHIEHLRSGRGLSRGRNAGLESARGDILAVPDDDCWYGPDLLSDIASFFERNVQFDVELTSVRDQNGKLRGPRRRSRVACECDTRTIWSNGISFNAFWRRSVSDAIGGFDERLGAGSETVYQSGEETDYFLRALESDFRIHFNPGLSVFHPLLSVERTIAQTYPYALGTGYVLRKHQCNVYRLCRDFLLNSFGGAFASFCILDLATAKVRFLRGMGQMLGYFSAGKMLKETRAAQQAEVIADPSHPT